MPPGSHDLALRLLSQVPSYLRLVSALLIDPTIDAGHNFPIQLDLRRGADGSHEVAYLRGMLEAAQALEALAEVEVGNYVVNASKAEAPREIQARARRLQAELEMARSDVATAQYAVTPVFQGEVVDSGTCSQAEQHVCTALATFVRLGQIVAMPALLKLGGNRVNRWLDRRDAVVEHLPDMPRTPRLPRIVKRHHK